MFSKKKTDTAKPADVANGSAPDTTPDNSPKSFFSQKIGMPVASIDFGFQSFSAEAPVTSQPSPYPEPLPEQEEEYIESFSLPPLTVGDSLPAEPAEYQSLALPPQEQPMAEFDPVPSLAWGKEMPGVIDMIEETEEEPFSPFETLSTEETADIPSVFEPMQYASMTALESSSVTQSIHYPEEALPSTIERELSPYRDLQDDFMEQSFSVPEGLPPIYTPPLDLPPILPTGLSGPSIDDFWAHYAPGFEETSDPLAAQKESQAAATFLDSVHHQLYPVEEQEGMATSTLHFPQDSASSAGASPALAIEEPALATILADDSLQEPLSPSAAAKWDYPDFSLTAEETSDPEASFPEEDSIQAVSPAMPSWEAPPASIEIAEKATDSLCAHTLPVATSDTYGDFSFEAEQAPEPEASPVSTPAAQPSFETTSNPGLENLEILALQPLDVDKTILLVALQETYALMGQINGNISVLKVFSQNPLSTGPDVFTVSKERAIGAQALYHVQVGPWQAVLKVDPQAIILHTELQG